MKALPVLLALSLPLVANADPKLAEKKNCLACHGVKEKIVGPGFKDVAAKYAGQAGAADKLAVKIRTGGGGVWGDMAMPPNDVTPAEAKTLAEWVLGLK